MKVKTSFPGFYSKEIFRIECLLKIKCLRIKKVINKVRNDLQSDSNTNYIIYIESKMAVLESSKYSLVKQMIEKIF